MNPLLKPVLNTLLLVAVFNSSMTSVFAQQKGIFNVAIFLYQDVELLDFAGPTEVFSSTSGFKVYTVSVDGKDILSQRLVTVVPQYSIANAPVPDIIVLPGGNSGPSSRDPKVIEWVQNSSSAGTTIMSVCTGAFILARAGKLDNLDVTTHHSSLAALQQEVPTSNVLAETRFVDNENILTTAGVSAGIDGALHMVARIKGIEVAKATAHYMEYDKWNPEDGKTVFQNPYLQNQITVVTDAPPPYEGELIDFNRKLQEEGDYKRSAQLLEQGIKWYPNSGTLYSLLSQAYTKLGKPAPMQEIEFMAIVDAGHMDEAERVYEKAMKDFPGWKIFSETAMNDKGYEFVRIQNYEMAIRILKLNTLAYPGSANVWDSLGEAYMISGNKKEATANYKKSLQLDPANENAKQMLEKLETMK